MKKNDGISTSIVHWAASYLFEAVSIAYLFVIGIRMTEKFMEQMDRKSEKKLNGRKT